MSQDRPDMLEAEFVLAFLIPVVNSASEGVSPSSYCSLHSVAAASGLCLNVRQNISIHQSGMLESR